ncbi:MAG: RsmF rRNA methyltransferase first C-terminal domain-containing protein [Clostridia bacterium]|nr:RsmF rRNA methyltransferase first C-terminal domain-containing protein [Clostridia bacterium]
MTAMLGEAAPAFFAQYECAPKKGLRVNTLKMDAERLRALLPYETEPLSLLPEGFLLPGETEGIGKHPLHLAGAFYLQEPSAMSALALLAPKPGMRVLDLCAAPGGKSTGIAARLKGEGLLVSNEIVSSRAKILAHNLDRMGVTNAAVTSLRPDGVEKIFPQYFDAVVVDAPCSGEGMFRKDEGAIAEWTPEHVKACAARQSLILESAQTCLAPGGRLVYSTCTFAPEENEGVVEAFLAAHPEFSLVEQHRYYPHEFPGEGHFAALLVKSGEPSRKKEEPFPYKPCKEKAYTDFMQETFEEVLNGKPALLANNMVMLLPDGLPKGNAAWNPLCAGVRAGEVKKGRFEPSHSLFMAAGMRPRRVVELGEEPERLAKYLAGETLSVAESLKGYCAVTCHGLALGFGKAVSGTLKNHLPKGLRVL